MPLGRALSRCIALWEPRHSLFLWRFQPRRSTRCAVGSRRRPIPLSGTLWVQLYLLPIALPHRIPQASRNVPVRVPLPITHHITTPRPNRIPPGVTNRTDHVTLPVTLHVTHRITRPHCRHTNHVQAGSRAGRQIDEHDTTDRAIGTHDEKADVDRGGQNRMGSDGSDLQAGSLADERCEERDGGQVCYRPHWTKLPQVHGLGRATRR